MLPNLFSIGYSTKDAMLGYMKEQNMPWLGLDFDSPLGEQLRGDFKCVICSNSSYLLKVNTLIL